MKIKDKNNTLYFGLMVLITAPFFAIASEEMAIGLGIFGLLITVAGLFIRFRH